MADGNNSAIAFWCRHCNKRAQWHAQRNEFDDKIDVVVICHGERTVLTLGLEMRGDVFPFRQVHSLLSPRDGLPEVVEMVSVQPKPDTPFHPAEPILP